jgi:hypothetical protein
MSIIPIMIIVFSCIVGLVFGRSPWEKKRDERIQKQEKEELSKQWHRNSFQKR